MGHTRGTGRRAAISHNKSTAQAVRLVVRFIPPEPTNQPPLVSNPGPQINTEEDSVNLQIVASDPEGGPLTYGATGLPPGLSLGASGLISGTLPLGSAGTYTITVSVSDGELSTSITFGWHVLTDSPSDIMSLDQSISSTDDDAEEAASGTVVLDDLSIEFVNEASAGDQTVGLRFNPISIPPGVTILDAYVQFTADGVDSQTTVLEIRGQAVDTAAPFTTNVNNLSDRLTSDAYVSWSPSPWLIVGEQGEAQRTPDLSAILQEIIDQPGWVANNALALLMTGSGRRMAVAADSDPLSAAQIHVEYVLEPGLRFAVLGDFGLTGTLEADVAEMIDSQHVDVVITVGDNNYPIGGADTIDENIGQHYQQYIKPYTGSFGPGSPDRNRFWPSLGNHDWDICRGISNCTLPYFDYFTLPNNERYYDVIEGPVHFFIIDSDDEEPDGVDPSSVQGQWLQNRLAASSARHKIVVLHHTPYTSANGNGPQPYMRWPFKDWGATLT